MDEDVHNADVARHFDGGNESGENEMPGQPDRAGPVFKTLAPGTVAHEQELHPRTAFQQLRRDRKQIVVAFELEQARDLPDHKVVGADAEPLTEVGIRSEEHTSELQSQSNLVCRL